MLNDPWAIYEYLMAFVNTHCPRIIERQLKLFECEMHDHQIKKIKERIKERIIELEGECDDRE